MKSLIFYILPVFFILNAYSQASESFVNVPTFSSTSYQTRTWTGDDGFDWTATQSRSDQTITGKAICFRGTSGGHLINVTPVAGGCGTLSFKYKRAYSGSSTMQVWVNGTQIGGNITVSSTSVTNYSQVVNVGGAITVEIKNLTSGKRIVIDDLAWTNYVSCVSPTTQASNFNSSAISCTSGTVSWTRGNGNNVLVVAQAGAAPTAPTSGTTYAANSTFGSGAAIGGGFVVYNGTGTSVNVTGLSLATTYHFAIYEYATVGTCYKIPGLAGSFTTFPSSLSDIVTSGGESVNVLSTEQTPGPLTSVQGTQVWRFTIRDGGAGNDADNLPTTLTNLVITQAAGNGMNDWAVAIRSVDLFDGATHLDQGTVTANTITFAGFTATAPDNGTKTLSMRLSLNCPATGSGNNPADDFGFRISQGNVTESGGCNSQFTNFTQINSANGKNVFTEIATTITSITPSNGAVGTVVTINATGGGFTGATAVDFNGTAASSFTVIDDNTIEAVVAAGTTTGDVHVTDQYCYTDAFSSFAIIDKATSSCEGTVIFPDIVMSEVYDNPSGSLGYIEIYNGTGAVVNLTTYTIDRYGNIGDAVPTHTYTFPAVGVGSSIANGQVLVGRISNPAGATEDFVFGGASGFNANDRLELKNGGTIVDDFHELSGATGYEMRRKPTILGPNPVFTASEWTSAASGDKSHLGTFIVSSGSEPTVNTHPTTTPLCSNASTTLSVAATEGFAGGLALAYQWYVSAPGAAGWTALTNAGVYSGVTTATLAISNVSGLNDYQYYCQVRENAATCYKASNAVQLDVYGGGGVAGLWVGDTDTDWCDCFNWDDGRIPTAATNVVINQTANNNCVVGAGCGGAVANTINISSNSATNRLLTIAAGGNLTVSNALNINKSAGTGNLIVETTGTGSLTVGSVSIVGFGGSQTAILRNQSAAANLDVNGDVTLNSMSLLDLNANGIIKIAGDFINNYSPAAFDEGSSLVTFDGTINQNINTNAFTEDFHHLMIDKTGGVLVLQDPITLDATGVLNLTNDQLVLNANILTISNPATAAITRTSGSIIEESGAGTGAHTGRIDWIIGSTLGAHEYPFATGVGGTVIPFVFNLTAGTPGTVGVSTYHTPATNLPWPSSPEAVTNLTSSVGLLPDNRNATVDRFWQIDKSGASGTATLTFSYQTSELPVAPYNAFNGIIAQRYNSTVNQWEGMIYPGQTRTAFAGGYDVTVPAISTFSPWTLSHISSPLPVELIRFDAEPLDNKVLLTWQTESEIDLMYYEVERSHDGTNFTYLLTKSAVGNSVSTLDYVDEDLHPLKGISYYRLKSYNSDGTYKISDRRKVEFNQNSVSVRYSDDKWTLDYKSISAAAEVELYNSIGEIVAVYSAADFQDDSFYISNAQLAKGTYLILIKDGAQSQSIKVIK